MIGFHMVYLFFKEGVLDESGCNTCELVMLSSLSHGSTGSPVTGTYYNQLYRRAPALVGYGKWGRWNKKLQWFEEVKSQFLSMQPNAEDAPIRDCHALFIFSPYEKFYLVIHSM